MNDTQKTFDIQATIKASLTQENIDDIMVSALEGGICYWVSKVVVVGGKYFGEYASEQISRGGELEIWLHEPLDDGKKMYILTRDEFLHGFQLWIEKGGDQCGAVCDGEVDCGEIDGCEADCIIQYALFDDIIFG